ncbi:alkaline phosphatase PafA [Flagellimonas meishanensis]|uniref:alkaline phosphatase PafA n=1 Tax=Flagellimonas meishanensis TaxID=2873264 RepID=UPI001CA74A97|nr:alkaline phosphatase PafA [[Muricauda] meishanensis]
MGNRNLISIIFMLLSVCAIHAQRGKKDKVEMPAIEIAQNPKLVVGIVVDQMRYDYLTRFWNHYGEGGFKRLVGEGFNCKNHHFNYMPTKTAPGHASIYTGTTPSVHGVLGNWWYDRLDGKSVYCVSDDNQNPIGTDLDAGRMSPHRMLVSTITDELRVNTQMRAKTIGIAIKDRGAILPAGFTANAAYWFEGKETGNWISSSFYMDQLPTWVTAFNSSEAAEKYKRPWETLKDINLYVESAKDANEYERKFRGEVSSTFPHALPELWDANEKFEMLRETPFGNSLTTDFAMAAIDGENLGTDNVTDFLAISYSSTDYVGHAYGVNSIEVQDAYLRLDKDIQRLLESLDQKVGKDDYMVFLTADHGVPPAPGYLQDVGIPGGFLSEHAMKEELQEFLSYRYGTTDILKNISNFQVFLDRDIVENLDMAMGDLQWEIGQQLLKNDKVQQVFTGYQMSQYQFTDQLAGLLQRGYHQKRSGDILFIPPAGYIPYREAGTDHGSPFVYDTHVPLLFYGTGIKAGSTTARTEVTDIAPTIATLLGIAFPNGTTGNPIEAVLE